MGDYELTAGQQQQIIDFLNAGNAVYLEGNDFGYFHKDDPVYDMFGILFDGDGNYINNVQNLSGNADRLMDHLAKNYTYGSAFPDQYVDFIKTNPMGGADILCLCQNDSGRLSAFSGATGNYRAMHSSFWFGAMKDALASHTKEEVMAGYMRYLSGDSLVVGLVDEISAGTGGEVNLFLENPVSKATRPYGVLGSVTGTSPGFPVGSVVLPLNWDVFTDVVILLWNTPVFENFLGNLDGSGRAMATVKTMTITPGAVGVTVNFAFLVANPIDFASNPVEVTIIP